MHTRRQICCLTEGPDDIRKAAQYNAHGLDICGAYGQAGIDLFKVLVQQLGITLVLYSESLISNPKYTPNVLLFCDGGDVQEQPMTTQQISRMVADEHHKKHPVIHILHHRADGKQGKMKTTSVRWCTAAVSTWAHMKHACSIGGVRFWAKSTPALTNTRRT